MCIIAYSPAKTPIPSAARRANMFRRNPDGAGFMFAVDGSVHVEKGFMSLKSLEDRLAELDKVYDFTALPVVFHFRIGTHGGNTPGNTHPFPVTRNRASLKALVYDTSLAVAHNGIIHCVKPKKGYSDTQEYIVRRLANIKRPYSKYVLDAILAESGSKFAFMYGNGAVQLVGAITEDADDGCFYSNTSYKGFTDMYIHSAPMWKPILAQHQSVAPVMQEYDFLPLDDDIVIDENGDLNEGVNYCMDVYGRIYEYDMDGCPVLTHGTHLLLSGMRREDDWDDETDIDWLYSTDKSDPAPW